jgi:cytochrome c oxidase subunit 4
MNQNESSAHTVGYGIYILVWIGLVVFTGLTVVVSGVDLKALAVTAALGIAATKSILVLFYFMHLKYEPPLFRTLVFVVVLALVTFIILTFLDVLFR